jgi:limonene-1,2-epoxide hydrolase
VTSNTAQQSTLAGLFAAIDARDTERFLAFLTTDARFRFGSAPAVVGHDQIRAAVDGFFSTIAGLRHEITSSIAKDETLVCEGEVSYTRHDGSIVSLPFVDVFTMAGSRVSNYKIYMDIAPLYAE